MRLVSTAILSICPSAHDDGDDGKRQIPTTTNTQPIEKNTRRKEKKNWRKGPTKNKNTETKQKNPMGGKIPFAFRTDLHTQFQSHRLCST